MVTIINRILATPKYFRFGFASTAIAISGPEEYNFSYDDSVQSSCLAFVQPQNQGAKARSIDFVQTLTALHQPRRG